jgi:PPK2 family polyphosphate:nucleotide phosphotransferase
MNNGRMKIKPRSFRVPPDTEVKLKHWPTRIKPYYKSKEHYQEILAVHVKEMARLQNLLYASGSYALLLVFQAMDAAGKDGAIKHVLSGINPQGCQVYSFKKPSATDLAHDFLWRTTICLPERGRIGIFNRSYYEEVLVVRVHPQILQMQNIPAELVKGDKIWKQRFRSIRNLEEHLHHNGTQVVKFFLHLSKEEQRKRFLLRIDDPGRNWKFSQADMQERQLWKEYTGAYEECLGATSTKESPWYVVPADDKENARIIISRIILETLKELKMSYPETSKERGKELQGIRKQLAG